MKICVITSGGNAAGQGLCAIEIAKAAQPLGWEVIGSRRANLGLMDDVPDIMQINPDDPLIQALGQRSGTFLLSNTNGTPTVDMKVNFLRNTEELGIDAFVIIGGDGSIRTLCTLFDELQLPQPVIGLGKTVDNDIKFVSDSMGLWSAVENNVIQLRALHAVAQDHKFLYVVKLMGRECHDIALYSSIQATDDLGRPIVDMCLGPESWNYETLMLQLSQIYNRVDPVLGATNYGVVVLSEAMPTMNGEPLIIGYKADMKTPIMGDMQEYTVNLLRTNLPSYLGQTFHQDQIRDTSFDHTQRGAPICEIDRQLARELGQRAVSALQKGISHQFVVNSGREFHLVPFSAFEEAGYPLKDRKPHNRENAIAYARTVQGLRFGSKQDYNDPHFYADRTARRSNFGIWNPTAAA